MTDVRGAKPIHLLRDYRAPPWRITDIDLAFDLDPGTTLVTARITVERDPSQPAQDLVLDAEDLELVDVRVDGRLLAAADVRHASDTLTVVGLANRAQVETRVRIAPDRNTALQGLYRSGSADAGFLLTQCEAEGFRRITPFIDRPDVLARYTVTLRADKVRYPLLLANGNRDGVGDLDNGRHWARFVDPHPKPSYLFALVAGRLEKISEPFVTAQGRSVTIHIHAEANAIGQCAWAMQCVKRAMRWDEERFGRCYDLDAFHVVATHDFTMGAMENKGLNIFNAKYLLADPQRATDDDYRHVLAVVGHEYFHNWSGNRVTCRDWFQLSLKEGLTVYREQEFEADLASRTLRRIEDVRGLWRAQFSEDAGPLAHPVRPDRYSEINNFYTATVYEKGAEIVRMLATLLGREGFRRGLDAYFERHDGRAATIEDFLDALGAANGINLDEWLAWYAQSGTPELAAHGRYDDAARCYELTLTQRTAPTVAQPRAQALPIPVAVALLDSGGRPLLLAVDGDDGTPTRERVLLLRNDRATFRFTGIEAHPVASILRGYSAPVRLVQDTSADELALLAGHESDGFNRWLAADTLSRRLFAHTLVRGSADPALLLPWTSCLARAIADPDADPALLAEMLTLADAGSLSDGFANIDPDAVHVARSNIESALSLALAAPLLDLHDRLTRDRGSSDELSAQARRRLANVCLATLCRADRRHLERARDQFADAANLTDRLAALGVLVHLRAEGADDALARFAERYARDALVMDKWFALQASESDPRTLGRVESLTGHPVFRWNNPNNVYALLGAFAWRNPRGFHAADGSGYRFVADAVGRLDAITPQVAARLATAFGAWRNYEPVRRALMHRELERLAAPRGNSPDLTDILVRSLAG